MISAEEIKCTVKEFVINNFLFGSTDNPFSDNDSFLEKGIIDSTGVLELIEFIETEYAIHIEDDETLPENLDSLDNVAAFVGKKVGGRQPPQKEMAC